MKKCLTGILIFMTFISILALLAGCSGGSSENESKYPEKSPIGSLQLDGWLPRCYLSGNRIFIAYGIFMGSEYGIYVIDVSNPAAPSQTDTISTPYNVEGMAFDGSSIYVLHLAYDLIDQWDTQLTEYNTGTLNATGNSIVFDEYGTGLAVSNGYAFVSFADSSADALHVIDLTTFTEKASYPLNNGSYHIRVNGNRAYLSGQSVALEIVDITDPETPSQVGFYPNSLGSAPQDLYIYDNYALLSSGSYGVAIIDISSESSPAFVKFNNEPGFARKITSSGTMMFLADQDSGVIIVDVSGGLDNAVVKGICKTTYTIQDICVSGNYVYALSYYAGPSSDDIGAIDVFDISSWQE